MAPPHELPAPWQVVRYLESQALTPAIYFLFGRRACEQGQPVEPQRIHSRGW